VWDIMENKDCLTYQQLPLLAQEDRQVSNSQLQTFEVNKIVKSMETGRQMGKMVENINLRFD